MTTAETTGRLLENVVASKVGVEPRSVVLSRSDGGPNHQSLAWLNSAAEMPWVAMSAGF